MLTYAVTYADERHADSSDGEVEPEAEAVSCLHTEADACMHRAAGMLGWWEQEVQQGVEAEARGGGEGSLWACATHVQVCVCVCVCVCV